MAKPPAILVEVRFHETNATLVWRDQAMGLRFVPVFGGGYASVREPEEFERHEVVTHEWATAVLRREGWLDDPARG